MSKGKVKEYNSDRGYGDIVDFESGQQLIVYGNYINLKKNEILEENQEVEYEIEKHRGGDWAVNVRIL